MAVGWLMSSRYQACLLMALPERKPWRRQRRWPCALSPIGSNMVSARPRQTISLLPLDSVAGDPGEKGPVQRL
jgi:hypothetical protein